MIVYLFNEILATRFFLTLLSPLSILINKFWNQIENREVYERNEVSCLYIAQLQRNSPT